MNRISDEQFECGCYWLKLKDNEKLLVDFIDSKLEYELYKLLKDSCVSKKDVELCFNRVLGILGTANLQDSSYYEEPLWVRNQHNKTFKRGKNNGFKERIFS